MGLKEKLLDDKIKSMKQLDQLQFNQKILNYKLDRKDCSINFILYFMSFFAIVFLKLKLDYLQHYGLYEGIYQLVINLFGVLMFVSLCILLSNLFIKFISQDRFNKELDNFIEDNTK